MPKTKRKFTVVVEPEADKGYAVHCPALPGCVSQGDNRREALKNIKEAIQLVLETLDEPATLHQDSPQKIAAEIHRILDGRLEDGLPLTIETAEVELSVRVPA